MTRIFYVFIMMFGSWVLRWQPAMGCHPLLPAS